jgi:hypothetical protein
MTIEIADAAHARSRIHIRTRREIEVLGVLTIEL